MNYPRGGGFQKKEKFIIISENVEGSDNAEWPSCKAFSLYQALDSRISLIFQGSYMFRKKKQ